MQSSKKVIETFAERKIDQLMFSIRVNMSLVRFPKGNLSTISFRLMIRIFGLNQ